MSLSVNQAYTQYYQIRLGTLTTKHQTQSNRMLLYTNQISDTNERINFYEQQKVLVLATPSGEQLAIKAEYFDTPPGFDSNNPDTWGDKIYYTTPCQKQLFIYRKAEAGETADIPDNDPSHPGWIIIPYEHTNVNDHESDYTAATLAYGIQDSRILSSKLASGEYTLVYTNDDFQKETIRYEDLPFIAEKQDPTAYQEMIELLEGEQFNLQEMEKKVKAEMDTTEVEIQAINALMESTEKVLSKNTESFKWG